MTNRYFDLIDQTFYFPQDGFELKQGYLTFNDIPLKYLIEKYGTPLKLTYLPRIGAQIKKARNLFSKAMKAANYQGKYFYCYCTKSSHFSFVLKEVLKNGAHLETSSAFDLDLVTKLYESGRISKNLIILNNGFKTKAYIDKIGKLIEEGFTNVIPVLDNKEELDKFKSLNIDKKIQIGIRMATEEEPKFEFYTSRLGIRSTEIVDFYREKIERDDNFDLKMLHFFVDTGIKDSLYYWGELKKAIKTYCELKKICPSLRALNIGGGMPIRNSLGFEFEYKYMVREIVRQIHEACMEENIPEPDIISEFGKYTVGESGATIFSVIGQKLQNDSELWYIIDNSLISTLPDSWGIAERFILLPINKWNNEYTRVNIGGLSCDNSDYYNAEAHVNQVFLPKFDPADEEPLYIGFFHTGAYQDALSGFGGAKHCLIPGPQHIILERDEKGNLVDKLVFEEQRAEDMLMLLGY